MESDDAIGEVSPPRALLPLAVFPPMQWFEAAQVPGSQVCVHEHYIKQSLRNRLALSGPQGGFDHVLPVHRRGAESRGIQDIRFTERVNPRQLMKVLQTNYGKAPYFLHIAPEIEAWSQAHLVPGGTLMTAALSSTEWACQWLDCPHPPTTTHYHPSAALDLRPKSAWPSPGGHPYPQAFADRHGFVGGRSILDVLFHLGPEASSLPSHHGYNDLAPDAPSP